ncbi:GIY-YIG nuclease family protein [Legionella israelensis]|uniref:GIY-YIG nuclease family protein n=1 Tax=Legionella israelensis TaxID=454 RepID=UPI001181310A|nr:GIY-YIG nuclease family protein [Legionella israelensis]QDP72126.1 GIY-YIG nuclease family protein [Legionella israelensis]
MSESIYWVYILRCEGNKYYTGFTNDLQKRYESHVNGTGRCKFTRSFKPLGIAQSWEIRGHKADALKIERYIKNLSRKEKEKLIFSPDLLISVLEQISTEEI